MSHYPAVLSYHARVPVRMSDGNIQVITADFSDWMSPKEVLIELGRALNVRTAGAIVEKVKYMSGRPFNCRLLRPDVADLNDIVNYDFSF